MTEEERIKWVSLKIQVYDLDAANDADLPKQNYFISEYLHFCSHRVFYFLLWPYDWVPFPEINHNEPLTVLYFGD